MFTSVLVANRGEIACRIFRTAKRFGFRTIAVYSDADANALHVREADEAVLIGPALAKESYLNIERVLEAAKATGADCIHPGYGFLSENAEFAKACSDAGITFVGPSPDAISAMGLKDAAKSQMASSGVPVVPGYHGDDQDLSSLARHAAETGYPVLIKAVAGGGGKGMRKVDEPQQFEDALTSAKREALKAFGDERVLIEKFISNPRHVEIQVFADRHGNAVHLFERDCSLQRRHQKVLEEAPAPGMSVEVRCAMGEAAVAAARAVDYEGAGTVEFIADGSDGLKADRFWFMEMNTRLQVEHPVTELITGVDLVEWQFRVASGEALPLSQEDFSIDGHAVEARIYAEDPSADFLPSSGKVLALDFAQKANLRIDAGVEADDAVSPHYDPMIAKVIAHGETRAEALETLSDALGQAIVAGPKNNICFLKACADHPGFRDGAFDTGFIEAHSDDLLMSPENGDLIDAAVLHLLTPEQKPAARDPWDICDGFQTGGSRRHGLRVCVEGEDRTVTIDWSSRAPRVCGGSDKSHTGITLIRDGDDVIATRSGRQVRVSFVSDVRTGDVGNDRNDILLAPMHGKVIAVDVNSGDAVSAGQGLIIVEAMKMEHTVRSTIDAVVDEVLVTVGDQVDEAAVLLRLETDDV